MAAENAKSKPGRVYQSSVPGAAAAGAGALLGTDQVNAAGEVMWRLGAPQCAGRNVKPYPKRGS